MSSPDTEKPNLRVPIIPKQQFVDPQVGEVSRVSSCRLMESSSLGDDLIAVPCSGGIESLVERNKIKSEIKIIESLKSLKEALTGKTKKQYGKATKLLNFLILALKLVHVCIYKVNFDKVK